MGDNMETSFNENNIEIEGNELEEQQKSPEFNNEDQNNNDEKLKAIKNGANWFYWIAGLSFVNTLAYLLNLNYSFVVGLSITQFIDILAEFIRNEWFVSSNAYLIQVIGVVINLIIYGVFIILGFFANKRYKSVFIIGIILYGLDAIIALLFQDLLSAGFHAIALYGIIKGLIAFKGLSQN